MGADRPPPGARSDNIGGNAAVDVPDLILLSRDIRRTSLRFLSARIVAQLCQIPFFVFWVGQTDTFHIIYLSALLISPIIMAAFQYRELKRDTAHPYFSTANIVSMVGLAVDAVLLAANESHVKEFLASKSELVCQMIGPRCAWKTDTEDVHQLLLGYVCFQYMIIGVLPFRCGMIALPAAVVIFCGSILVTVLSALAMTLYAKYCFDRQQRALHVALRKQRQQVVHERVLRYGAEFKVEQLKSNTVAEYDAMSSYQASTLSASAASARTAPGVLEGCAGRPTLLAELLPGSTHCAGQDCLSPDSCVWVLGEPNPMPLRTVREGQHVLAISPGLSSGAPVTTYVPVRRKETVADRTCKWVRLALEDGAEVLTTAGHPILPHSVRSGENLGTVRAADVTPGLDALWVWNPRLAKVLSVEKVDTKEAPAERVIIELGATEGDDVVDSERAPLLMVASPHDGGPSVGFTAVGDARRSPASTRLDALLKSKGIQLTSHGCGLDLVLESELPLLRRSNSCPDMRRERESRPPARVGRAAGEKVGHTTITSSSSATSAMSTAGSNVNVEIELGGHDQRDTWRIENGEWTRTARSSTTPGNEPAVRLSDYVALTTNSDRPLSYGSLGHASHGEKCKVCAFTRPGRICKNGALCNFCHAAHRRFKSHEARGNRVPHSSPERRGPPQRV